MRLSRGETERGLSRSRIGKEISPRPLMGAPSLVSAFFCKDRAGNLTFDLDAVLPVSRFSPAVRDRDDHYRVEVVKVNDGEWEPANDEPAGSVQIFRPAARRLGDTF